MVDMRIAFCSAEAAPWAKVGGLADVAGSLPRALNKLGHEAVLVVPGYGHVFEALKSKLIETREGIAVQIREGHSVHAVVHRCQADGYEVWLVDAEEKFFRIKRSEDVYSPNRDDYLMFSHAVLRVCEALDWLPDMVHAHDWHMGFLPVILREKFSGLKETAAVFTIHNLAYQGVFGFDTLAAAGLSESLFTYDKLETWGAVNFIKSGCVFADQVNTVSPSYALEITTPEYGCGLEGLMEHLEHQERLTGILNGIAVEEHDPARDPELPQKFSASDPSGKLANRRALLDELKLNLRDNEPICAMITRLSEQKGFDLLMKAAPQVLGQCGLVVLGLGDPWAAGELRRLEKEWPGRVRFVNEFNAPLGQRIYGAADIFLMPSAFEPCGLGQMFAMRYGAVPVVRRTGGLADTVFEGRNGFVFENRDGHEFALAIERAIHAFRNPAQWTEIVREGMTTDFSWDRSAMDYIRLYERALASRREPAAVG